jgi:hypothetical protein
MGETTPSEQLGHVNYGLSLLWNREDFVLTETEEGMIEELRREWD